MAASFLERLTGKRRINEIISPNELIELIAKLDDSTQVFGQVKTESMNYGVENRMDVVGSPNKAIEAVRKVLDVSNPGNHYHGIILNARKNREEHEIQIRQYLGGTEYSGPRENLLTIRFSIPRDTFKSLN